MPKNDYNDPELPFPRLQVRIQRMDGESHWLQVWLWKQAGGPSEQVFNSKGAGSWRDAHGIVQKLVVRHKAETGPDDFDVE